MATISQLNAITTLTGSDNFRVYANAHGDTRKSSITTLQAYMQSNLTFSDSTAVPQFTKQFSAPSATGFTVQVTDNSNNTWLILTPTAGFAAGTITLPAVANVVDLQIVKVICTQAVTALTVGANGATAVTGEPTTLAANDFFQLQYDSSTSTWYRNG